MQSQTEIQPEFSDLDRWKPLGDFLKSHPQFHEGQMRWLLRHREQNGLENAVRKIGRNLYVHEDMFSAWIFSKSP